MGLELLILPESKEVLQQTNNPNLHQWEYVKRTQELDEGAPSKQKKGQFEEQN